jgi:hypothetical protein
MLGVMLTHMRVYWSRLQQLREDDRGMTTEAIVVTGLLVVLAIAVLAIITRAVTNRANRIEGDINGT